MGNLLNSSKPKPQNQAGRGSLALTTREKGLAAEARVARFLEEQGYEVVEKNFLFKGGEIDLIAIERASRILVFIEVRSAKARSPWLRYTITAAKQRRLLNAAESFVHRLVAFRSFARRFDLVWVEGERIEHWKNVTLGYGR